MMSTTPGETHKYTNIHLVLNSHCEERWKKCRHTWQYSVLCDLWLPSKCQNHIDTGDF